LGKLGKSGTENHLRDDGDTHSGSPSVP